MARLCASSLTSIRRECWNHSIPDLQALRTLLGTELPDELLELALTHPSAVGEGIERTLRSNQRLEFLGDAVLGACAAAHLYETESTLPEGKLTLRKIALVQKPTLARAAREMGLGSFLILGRGEEAGGGRERDAILADALEALIGAVFLASGWEAAQEFAFRALQSEIQKLQSSGVTASAKNLLQERTQAQGFGTPSYQTTTTQSVPPVFASKVVLQDVVWGEGTGASKKEAESNAARIALEKAEQPAPIAEADG
jgi:ribonuclease-3